MNDLNLKKKFEFFSPPQFSIKYFKHIIIFVTYITEGFLMIMPTRPISYGFMLYKYLKNKTGLFFYSINEIYFSCVLVLNFFCSIK